MRSKAASAVMYIGRSPNYLILNQWSAITLFDKVLKFLDWYMLICSFMHGPLFVLVETESGSSLWVHKLSQADLVLGCDGIRSAVRTALRTAGADVEQKRFAVPWNPMGASYLVLTWWVQVGCIIWNHSCFQRNAKFIELARWVISLWLFVARLSSWIASNYCNLWSWWHSWHASLTLALTWG